VSMVGLEGWRRKEGSSHEKPFEILWDCPFSFCDLLRVGTHTLELRNAQGQTSYQEQINVIAGKKLKIKSDYVG